MLQQRKVDLGVYFQIQRIVENSSNSIMHNVLH